jgi:hypothetical protein
VPSKSPSKLTVSFSGKVRSLRLARLPYQQIYSPYMMMRELPRAEVLHPLFVKRQQAEPLRIGHLTDLHVAVRADVYEANLDEAMKFVPSADDLAAFNKPWETLRQKLVAFGLKG